MWPLGSQSLDFAATGCAQGPGDADPPSDAAASSPPPSPMEVFLAGRRKRVRRRFLVLASGVAAAGVLGVALRSGSLRLQRAPRAVSRVLQEVSEPAHARMCRTIVQRLDALEAGVRAFELAVFTEGEAVCRDLDRPHTAMLNIIAALLLDAAGNALGLQIRYTHRCKRWGRRGRCRGRGNGTTVQLLLPDPLRISAFPFQAGGCLGATALRSLCGGCAASADPADPDCVLFPEGYRDAGTGECSLQCHFTQVLPWLRHNLREAATNWLADVDDHALTFWQRSVGEFGHREKDDAEVAVVSLSCANDDCTFDQTDACHCEFYPLPNWAYAQHIPRSATNIAILVTPTCARFGAGCARHADELLHFLASLYPRAEVTYNVVEATSSWYMRMLTAGHLLCPAGVGCLLPAIARDAYTVVYEAPQGSWLACLPPDYLARFLLGDFPPLFAPGDCRHLRGRLGVWERDLELAPQLQYDDPVAGYLGCADASYVPTIEDPHRPPTTYRWDETIWQSCPVELLTKVALCAQMARLGLGRILFVGDHTTLNQAVSLVSILGHNDDISLDPAIVPNFSKTIDCVDLPDFNVTYIRNDRLEEVVISPSPGSPNCGPDLSLYCYPWSSDYATYEQRQLLVFNTGYHWGADWEGFIINFKVFVGRIDEISAADGARARDVLMFRTSVPGHRDCHLYFEPFRNYGRYCRGRVNGARWHWWGRLPIYNDYAIRIINEWNIRITIKSGPNIELLDVWLMTILRPDGHLSGSDAVVSCAMEPWGCLLYSLPGPIDWWNHLLVMQLTDVGTHLESGSLVQAWR